MAQNEYLDKAGLAILWERIRRLVAECCNGGGGVTYTLESHDNVVTLVGSDGTRSSVSVISTAVCNEEK